ncbi:MAG: tyrosine-type recombinase/integrase [Arenicella sp.]
MLTDTKVKGLKSKEKAYKVSDSNGLYIHVQPTGSKLWKQKYRFNGKEKLLSHGKYPQITLTEARELRNEALKNIQHNIDPAKVKRQEKVKQDNTFEVVAREWHEKQSVNWKPHYAKKVWFQLECDILPYLVPSGKKAPLLIKSRGFSFKLYI